MTEDEKAKANWDLFDEDTWAAFAAHAMNGLVIRYNDDTWEETARNAGLMADALLAELRKRRAALGE